MFCGFDASVRVTFQLGNSTSLLVRNFVPGRALGSVSAPRAAYWKGFTDWMKPCGLFQKINYAGSSAILVAIHRMTFALTGVLRHAWYWDRRIFKGWFTALYQGRLRAVT